MSIIDFKVTFILTTALGLAACGGGGSSSTQSTTPPISGGGGTNNSAPVVAITATDTSPLEGQMSTLDGSSSSDADGDDLTFTWTQLSGPTVSFSAQNNAVTDISVPNLTADVAARIQLQVSDGVVTSSNEITLNLSNLVLNPIANSTITNEVTFNFPNDVLALPVDLGGFETTNYLIFESEGEFTGERLGYSASDGSALEIFESFTFQSPTPNIQSTNLGSIEPLFAAFESDRLSFVSPFRGDDAELFSVEVDEPCAVINDTNFSAGNIIVGLRNGGAVLFETLADSSFQASGTGLELQRFGGMASLCALQFSSGNQSLNPPNSAGLVNTRLLAFDENTNEVLSFVVSRGPDGRLSDLTEDSSLSIDLGVTDASSLSFVGSTNIDAAASTGIALLYSDGETEGEHRLVIIGLNSDGSISQDIHSWDYGVPTSIVSSAIDDHPGDTLFITTADSPYAVIFQSGPVFTGPVSYLPLTGPFFFDVGVGHGLAAPISGGSPRTNGTLITYPDENLIRVFQRD